MSGSGRSSVLPACPCSLPQSQEQVQFLSASAHLPEPKSRTGGAGGAGLDFGSQRDARRSGGEAASALEPADGGALASVSAWRQGSSARGQKAGGAAASTQKAGTVQHAPPNWWEAEQFDLWLEQRLTQERTALVARLQECVGKRLEGHYKFLSQELQDRFLSDASNAGASAPPVHLEPALAPAPAALGVKLAGSEPAVEKPIQGGDAQKAVVCQDAVEKGVRQASVKSVKSQKSVYKFMDIANLAPGTPFFLDGDQGRLKRLVSNRRFDMVVGVAILLNLLVMALEVQVIGCRVSSSLQHSDCLIHPEEKMPGITTAFTVSTMFFTVFFLVEFLLRLNHLRMYAVMHFFMWFDLLLVIFGILDAVGRFGGVQLDFNPSVMRTARVGRLVRVVRVLKFQTYFDTLFVLLKSIMATRHTLVWSVLILFMAMSTVGIVINQLTVGYMEDAGFPAEQRREVYELFGTYTRVMVTMGEITLGNWAPSQRTLMVNVSQWWGVFILLYRCVLCLALVNVTTAVFISETNRVALDNEVAIMHKKRKDVKNTKLLTELFQEIDESGDGLVSVKEMAVVVHDEAMKNLLSLMDLEVQDVSELLFMMSDGEKQIDKDGFIRGVLALKGDAKSSGQTKLLMIAQDIQETVDKVHKILTPQNRALRAKGRSGSNTSIDAPPG